ncbi:tachykinin-like peptides receptor 86C [Actinia tenebrosa]|uniref:Tachykinin-like peptides receptor 86C n=1 Tax=Actinia tenebrosa TaxID=6105 RepID=A0A6P8HM48_ACTTE|nr:tachykinin-like peptides receptor 86C [Actinia tenebrosa]
MVLSAASEAALTAAFGVMIFTDLIGNTLVILTVIKTRAMRTPMNYLLANLAVADITVALFIAPRYIFSHAYTHPGGQVGTYLCKFLTGEVFTWVGALTSVYTLVAISFERYYAVMQPQSIKGRFTLRKFQITAASCWTFATLWNIPLFTFFSFDEKNQLCNFVWPFPDFPKYHSTINAFVYGAIPIGTMVCLYSRVTYRLWFKQNDHTSAATQQGTIKARKRVTKMVLIVSIIFSIMWMPNLVTYPVSAYSEVALYDAVHVMSIVFVTLNSSINPIVYSLQSNMFRRNIWRVVTCGKNNRVENETTGNNSTDRTNASVHVPQMRSKAGNDMALASVDL